MTPEEEALWRKAMRDVAAYGTRTPPPQTLVSPAQGHLAPARLRISAPAPRIAAQTPASHPFQAGDPRLDKRAGRGRLPIDAVLDLHGHTQTTAHGALSRFIAGCHGRGARCVLVITGKGAGDSSGAGVREGRGVLRARFEEWLTEEPLRRLVSRSAPAYQRHGGGGAFYVFLKR